MGSEAEGLGGADTRGVSFGKDIEAKSEEEMIDSIEEGFLPLPALFG